MTQPADKAEPGKAISASHYNDLVDAVNSKRTITSSGALVSEGGNGTSIIPQKYDKFRLFIIAGEWTWPNYVSADTDKLNLDPTPYVDAKQMFMQNVSDDDKDGADDPVYSYTFESSEDYIETIYAPIQFHNEINRPVTGTSDGYSIGIETVGEGDRCLCGFNLQSGRWELMSEADHIWRFELISSSSTSEFVPGDSHDAVLYRWTGSAYDAVDAAAITVYDPLKHFTGFWDANYGGGTRGWCKYNGDSQRWEIITHNVGTVMEAEATADWNIDVSTQSYYVDAVRHDTQHEGSSETIRIYFHYEVDLNQYWMEPEVYNGDKVHYIVREDGIRIAVNTQYTRLGALEWRSQHRGTSGFTRGWAVCNGQALPSDKKIPLTNAPNMQTGKRGIVHATSTTGTQGGVGTHGNTVNDHNDHTKTTIQVESGAGPFVIQDFAANHTSTDNYHPYITAVCWIRYK